MIKDETAGPIKFESEDDLNQTVNEIVESLRNDIKGYQEACQMYDSTFFENESPEFKKALCTALVAKFPEYKNNYWNELAAG